MARSLHFGKGSEFIRLRLWGLGFRVWGLGFGVWGLRFRVWGLGFRVWGLGFRVYYGAIIGFRDSIIALYCGSSEKHVKPD